VNPYQIVITVVKCYRSGVIVELAREAIGQARVAPHVGTHCPVVALGIAGADMLRVWTASYYHFTAADALRWTVAGFVLTAIIAVHFH
jgi:hypothetical protein